MKACLECAVISKASSMICAACGKKLSEITLAEALELTSEKSFRRKMAGTDEALSDYLVSRYLGGHSFFLQYDICKNRLKQGRRAVRFFIQPVNAAALFNIPWLLCNIVYSNLFHLEHTAFCERCQCKSIPDHHASEECDYNIEYASIFNDILGGQIVRTKTVYEANAHEKRRLSKKSAYFDLFEKRVNGAIFWDILSIGFSLFSWVYLVVFVSLPFFRLFLQGLDIEM